MKNRRILSHPELEPNQIRAIDAFSDFDSSVVNNITKISHKTDQPDVIIDGLNVIEDCSENVEYVSQDLIDYSKFTGYNNCHISDRDLQIYVSDDDPNKVKDGYIQQNLNDNNCLDLERFFGSDITQTFLVSFSVTDGTPKNLFITIGETVLDFKYLDGAYDNETNRYTVALDVNFKNISRNLVFKIGAYIDILEYRNFFSRDEYLGVSFLTISDISCRMVIKDRSKEYPFYASENWDINNTRLIKHLRIDEGTAVKDNVVLSCLESVNVGNSAVTLSLSDPKSWIHSNPYTAHDFYDNGREEMFDVKVDVIGNSNLEFLYASIDENGDFVSTIRNNQTGTVKQLPLTDYNHPGSIEIDVVKISEGDDYIICETRNTPIKSLFCSNTIVIKSKDKIITKLDVVLTPDWCTSATFKVFKKDFDSVEDIKAYLCDAVVKVSKNSRHPVWGYVVCYYSYYKNPNPNACYIGLVKESEFLKEGFTEDYLVLAKVRFVDPNTIDLIQYVGNRNNYQIPTARDVNYIVTFNHPDIWYNKNPVTLTDAINYLQIIRVNVLKRFKLKHDNNAPADTSFRILNTDAQIDKKGRISVDLRSTSNESSHHLHRRIAPETRVLKVISVRDSGLDMDNIKEFRWNILTSKWLSPDNKWAINSDFTKFGLYDPSANDISNVHYGFNNVGPYKFINPRTRQVSIIFDWDYSTLKDAYIPQNDSTNTDITRFDLADDDSYVLSYYPAIHGVNDVKYIVPLKDEVVNSRHNHFSYIQFRNQLLSKKYMIKMLDMLPLQNVKTKQYLIDGRILTSIDGHIVSSIHETQLHFDDNTLINCEVIEPGVHDIIKSTSYVISTNNYRTRGNAALPSVPKLLQDKQLLIYGADESGKKEIQSSNYIIDDLRLGYVLVSTTDSKGIIHITSGGTRYSIGGLTDKNTVIGRVFENPRRQEIDTDKYYFSTTNYRTISSQTPKFFQDYHLLLANTDSDDRTAIESTNIIIDDNLTNNHIITDTVDENSVIHIKSSKNQFSNELRNGNLVVAKDVSDTNATISTVYYEISTKNPKTGDSNTDKLLQDGQIIAAYPGEIASEKSIESCNVIIDSLDTDNYGRPYVKISEKDSNGVIHIKNTDKVIDELIYDLCYLPTNICIKDDNKIHITIDSLKKFRITSSQILKAVQNDPKYSSIFNYDLDTDNPVLFNLVLHFDITNIKNATDRDHTNDNRFKVSSNVYESEILYINDIGLSEIRRHIVTEQERDHVVTEDEIDSETGEASNKHLVLENDEFSKFRSCISVEYQINDGAQILNKEIQWIDEYRGYDNRIEEFTYDPDRPHIIGETEDVTYKFATTDVDADSSDDVDVVDGYESDDVTPSVRKTYDVTTPDESEDNIEINELIEVSDIEEVGDIVDVDTIEFSSTEIDTTATPTITASEFETESIDTEEFETPDSESKSEAIDIDLDSEAVDINADNISLYRPHIAAQTLFDISSFMSLYPCVLLNQRWARILRSDHGWGDARGPIESIFAQTKVRITFNVVKNNTDPVRNLIPGITFSDTEDKTIYAYSETYNIE